jgi:CRISPR-associated protein Cas6
VVPELHGALGVGVHPIRGQQTAPGVLSLTRWSRLKIRLPAEQIAPYITVAGKELDLDGHRLRVGIPQVESLIPAPNLAARLVSFKHALSPEVFVADVRRELDRMRIAGKPVLVPATNPKFAGQPLRRVLRIKDKRVVGYALRVMELTAEESMRLQQEGLGGRRRMGCGLFVPLKEVAGR